MVESQESTERLSRTGKHYILSEEDRRKSAETRQARKAKRLDISNAETRRMFIERLKDPKTDSRTWVKLYVLFEAFKAKCTRRQKGGPQHEIDENELTELVQRIESETKNQPRLQTRYPTMTRAI